MKKNKLINVKYTLKARKYNCLKLIWIFYFLFVKRLNNMARQHIIPWNKVRAVTSILHTVGVNWNSHSEIETAYTGKCDVALNNKQVLRV